MQIGFHHHHKQVLSSQELSQRQRKLTDLVDKLIYIIGTFGVLIYIPQLWEAITAQDIAGISLLSWSGMFAASVFWTYYGIIHKAKPIIFINVLASIIQLSVVLVLLVRG